MHFIHFFKSFSPFTYSFYATFISSIISKFKVKHSDNKVHISFDDYMFCKDKFTTFFFLFALVNNGIPFWFRCFKGKHNSDTYSIDLIKEGLSFVLIFFLIKIIILFFLLIVGFLTLKFFLIFNLLAVFYYICLNLILLFLIITL